MIGRRLPAAAETLLPHRGRMCCIDSLVALKEGEALAEVLLTGAHVLVDGQGRMDPCGFIELAAQTAGAMSGAKASGAPGMAMLAGAQKVVIGGEAHAGDRLRVGVSVLGEVEGMMSLAFFVRRAGAPGEAGVLLADGRLTVFLPTEGGMPLPVSEGRREEAAAFPPALPGSGLPESVARCSRKGPELLERTADRLILEGRFVFPPEFPGFEGHFPGNPIVPGMVQMMAALRTAACGAGTRLRAVKKCKFLRPVLPAEELTIRTELSGPPDERRCKARVAASGEACAEMALTFAEL